MTSSLMDDKSRDLILAAEITGLLHDLGKLRPEFAEEKLKGGEKLKIARALGISESHGAILEKDKRAYPPAENDTWLEQIKNHDDWKKVLELPKEWIQPNTVQALGLGDALRQHHVIKTTKDSRKKGFLETELTLLGDIYAVGADWRDSALDKGSGKTQSGNQKLETAFIADSFGNEKQAYNPSSLEIEWQKAESIINNTLLSPKACQRVDNTRQIFLDKIKPIFKQALGETRRPTNDVTLWHHCFSTASLFKAAIAECVLRQKLSYLQNKQGLLDFSKLWHIRFRLLGIRWDWAGLTQGALKPVVFTALTKQRDKALDNLRQLLEVYNPIGNIIYDDDDGIILAVPGFYEGLGNEQASELLFSEKILDSLETKILNALTPLGAGAAVRIAWTQPRLYLTDYAEVMEVKSQGERERILQVGEKELKGLWEESTIGQLEICSQCGLRPSKARELEITESILIVNKDEDKHKPPQGLCDYCTKLADEKQYRIRWEQARKNDHFGFIPETFNLQDMQEQRNKKENNPRVVLISLRIDAQEIANGMALLTQIARPSYDLEFDYDFTGDEIHDWSVFCKLLTQTKNHGIAQEFFYFLGKYAQKSSETRKKVKCVQDSISNFASNSNKSEKQQDPIIEMLSIFLEKKYSKFSAMQQAFSQCINKPKPFQFEKSSRKIGDFLQKLLDSLEQKQDIDSFVENLARTYLGEKHWLKKDDGRIKNEDAGQKALELIEEFFLRECVPPSLFRHEGDCLALFGMRKHASPGRLSRIWDDLRQLWKDILSEISTKTDGCAIPLSLDAQGFRVIVAAEDARAALTCIHDKIEERLGKVRAGFNPHVSAIVFKDNFPLYIAFDAIRRMEKRISNLPPQKWKLLKKEDLNSNFLRLTWEIPSGDEITWTMNLYTGDSGQKDLWYPHVICTSNKKGPGRIVHVENLNEGDVIELRPSTFDFVVLEGTARRYQLAYDKKTGCRYHFILGESGRPPYLLEQMPEIMNLVPETLGDWDATRRKGIFGQVVEYYEKWVRDVPDELREQGRQAWHTHVNAILLRYLHKDVQHKREEILGMLDDGRFFDAFEWADFVEKSVNS